MWRARTLAHESRAHPTCAKPFRIYFHCDRDMPAVAFFQAKKFTGASERVTRKGNNVIAKCAIDLAPPRIAENLDDSTP